jgi:hypothetical protein
MMRNRHLITISILLFLVWAALPFFVSAMTITIGIPEKYSEVKAGEKVYFETEVKWPENVGRKDLSIEYSIRDKNGVEVAYLKVLKAIETQASFMSSISIPESLPAGMYKLSAGFNDYKDLNQEVVASFNVAKASNNVEKYLFIIIGVLGVIVLLVLMEMIVLTKRNSHK